MSAQSDLAHSRRPPPPHAEEGGSSRAASTSSSSAKPAEAAARSWMQWFLGLKGNNFFCKVDKAYMLDQFNLYGLRPLFSNYREVLDMILGPDISDTKEAEALDRHFQDAVDLFGLIHARFIITRRGQSRMARKFKRVSFGKCPRALCQRQALLPVGLQDTPRKSGVKVFCPCCAQTFEPEPKLVANYIDGAYFGTTFPHLLLMEHPELRPKIVREPYIPRIFGYRVFDEASGSLLTDAATAAEQSERGSAGASAGAGSPVAGGVIPTVATIQVQGGGGGSAQAGGGGGGSTTALPKPPAAAASGSSRSRRRGGSGAKKPRSREKSR